MTPRIGSRGASSTAESSGGGERSVHRESARESGTTHIVPCDARAALAIARAVAQSVRRSSPTVRHGPRRHPPRTRAEAPAGHGAADARARRRASCGRIGGRSSSPAIALVFAAAAVLAIGQGSSSSSTAASSPATPRELDRTLALMLGVVVVHGRGDVRALLLRVVARRAGHRRPAARGVRPSADAAARVLRGRRAPAK